MLCRLLPEPGGHRAAAPLARGEVGSVQSWGRLRDRAKAGPVVHVCTPNEQSEAENGNPPHSRGWHPEAEPQRGLRVTVWLKAAF